MLVQRGLIVRCRLVRLFSSQRTADGEQSFSCCSGGSSHITTVRTRCTDQTSLCNLQIPDAVIDLRRSMLRFPSPACRRSHDQASRNRTSTESVCRVVCPMWIDCPKLTGRCTSRSCQESTERSSRLKVAPARRITSVLSVPFVQT